MPCYVDDMQMQATVPNGTRSVTGKWSHLTADTDEELHALAAKIGLRREWFQPARVVADNEYTRAKCPERIGKPFPGSRNHYDVTEPKRKLAIKYGAVPCAMGREPWRDRRKDERDADGIFGEGKQDGRHEATGGGTPTEAAEDDPREADGTAPSETDGGYEPVTDGSHYGQ